MLLVFVSDSFEEIAFLYEKQIFSAFILRFEMWSNGGW